MPPKKKAMQGKGIFKDIWKGIKKGNDWLRKTKAISNVANSLVNIPIPGISNVAKKVGETAASYGYGKKKGRGKGRVIKV
jgi:hypothetical protein